jgi:hypothetical protein
MDGEDERSTEFFSSLASKGPLQQQCQQQQHEDDWDWEETLSVATANTESADFLVDCLPPQLHPAVSLGIHRVSSCAYFSLQGSCDGGLDLYSLSSEVVKGDGGAAADWLYHDILMVVMTFLDAKSLAAFSETARRSNFEVYYFLQLQLQRALLDDDLSCSCLTEDSTSDADRLASIAGCWSISRLASLDAQEAHNVVQEYLDSNCTLRTMPLSHSLAYIRQVLRRNGFPAGDNNSPMSQKQSNQTLTTSAQAALLIGLVGAATVMSGNHAEVVESFGSELPNMLFKVGMVGTMMGAVGHQWEAQHRQRTRHQQQELQPPPPPPSQQEQRQAVAQGQEEPQSTMRETAEQMRETAEHMARSLQDMLQQLRMAASSDYGNDSRRRRRTPTNNHGASISQRIFEAFLTASGRQVEDDAHNQSLANRQPYSPNPYDHLEEPSKTRTHLCWLLPLVILFSLLARVGATKSCPKNLPKCPADALEPISRRFIEPATASQGS